MNEITEEAYRKYNEGAKKAAQLASTLRELYGIDTPAEHIMARARIDKVIDEFEIDLIRKYNSL